MELETFIENPRYPSLDALLRALPDAPGRDALRAVALQCVQPAYAYFREKFIGTVDKPAPLKQAMAVFKAARLVHPFYYQTLHEQLRPLLQQVPFVCGEHIAIAERDRTLAALEAEHATYLRQCQGADIDVDLEQWWRSTAHRMPKFADLAWCFALIQPSSAASERVFADGRLFEGDQQASMLEDCHQAGMLSRVNERNRRNEQSRV